MSFKQYFKVIDTPLAIVVGSVGVVLITLQVGALGLLVQSQVDRATEREAGLKAQHGLVAECQGSRARSGYAACVQQQQKYADKARYTISSVAER